MSRVRRTLLASAGFLAAALAAQGVAAAQEEGRGDRPLTGRALVSVAAPQPPTGDSRAAAAERRQRRTRSRELLAAVAGRNALEVQTRSAPGGLLAVELRGESVAQLRERLSADPLVRAVRPEQRAQPRLNPNDPAFLHHDPNAPLGDFAQWHLAYAGFPRAWELGKGEGGEVAVLDSGVYVDHPDLAGRVADAIDCSGIVCLGSDVSDGSGHGTHVAGLACADSDNGYGLASAGFDCSLYAVRTSLGYASIINSIYAAADPARAFVLGRAGDQGRPVVEGRATAGEPGVDLELHARDWSPDPRRRSGPGVRRCTP